MMRRSNMGSLRHLGRSPREDVKAREGRPRRSEGARGPWRACPGSGKALLPQPEEKEWLGANLKIGVRLFAFRLPGAFARAREAHGNAMPKRVGSRRVFGRRRKISGRGAGDPVAGERG